MAHPSNFHRFHIDKTPIFLSLKSADSREIEIISRDTLFFPKSEYWLFPVSLAGRVTTLSNIIFLPKPLLLVRLKKFDNYYFIAIPKEVENPFQLIVEAYYKSMALPPLSTISAILSSKSAVESPRWQTMSSEVAKMAAAFAGRLEGAARILATQSKKTVFASDLVSDHFYQGSWLINGIPVYPVTTQMQNVRPTSTIRLCDLPEEHYIFGRIYKGVEIIQSYELNPALACVEIAQAYINEGQLPPQSILMHLRSLVGRNSQPDLGDEFQAVFRQAAKINHHLVSAITYSQSIPAEGSQFSTRC